MSQSTPNEFLMEHALLNDFTLNYEYLRNTSIYFILSWSVKYTRKQIINGTILKDGVRYRVVFHRNKRGVKDNDALLLSFRRANSRLYPRLLPTVLIAPKEKEREKEKEK